MCMFTEISSEGVESRLRHVAKRPYDCHGSRQIQANILWRAVLAPPIVMCSANNQVFSLASAHIHFFPSLLINSS